uniref:WAT1-related protein n=1 Tax=Salix viminalis TaxID=40686 RepID=A0A6N2KK34_SALVM
MVRRRIIVKGLYKKEPWLPSYGLIKPAWCLNKFCFFSIRFLSLNCLVDMKNFDRAKPFIAVTFLQAGFAGMDILSKAALNQGMSNYVLVVYRHAVATVVIAPFAVILDKKLRPKMTLAIFIKLVALSLLEPVIDQNLYFLGMKYTTATFAAAIVNVLPAITFVIAWIVRK